MISRQILLAGAIALALSACGNSSAPAEAPAADAAPAAEAPAAEAPAEAAPAEAAPAAAASTKPAVVENCATTIEANDAMQYNADSITVPASCTQFTINLKHTGTMAATVMGHNVVIAKAADAAGIAADGASNPTDHVKEADTRSIAHTKIIGGGESTSVTFDVSKIKDGGPYEFFCSFPGHLALMKGSIQVQ
ncbi:MAG: azurin [Thermomonas sp.]|uniref:azurin n=1 Tax=Thermomonas sp. TaxID=1971895 RepID=UPI001EB16200|nr:azurin [Thermomonas sp.]MBV2209160.1 azurin [Thermomonas sp.]